MEYKLSSGPLIKDTFSSFFTPKFRFTKSGSAKELWPYVYKHKNRFYSSHAFWKTRAARAVVGSNWLSNTIKQRSLVVIIYICKSKSTAANIRLFQAFCRETVERIQWIRWRK